MVFANEDKSVETEMEYLLNDKMFIEIEKTVIVQRRGVRSWEISHPFDIDVNYYKEIVSSDRKSIDVEERETHCFFPLQTSHSYLRLMLIGGSFYARWTEPLMKHFPHNIWYYLVIFFSLPLGVAVYRLCRKNYYLLVIEKFTIPMFFLMFFLEILLAFTFCGIFLAFACLSVFFGLVFILFVAILSFFIYFFLLPPLNKWINKIQDGEGGKKLKLHKESREQK